MLIVINIYLGITMFYQKTKIFEIIILCGGNKL